jgi:ATP-dependent DNA helicase DinG
MLSNQLKQTIQKAYSQFLDAQALKPRYGQRLMIAHIANAFADTELDDEDKRTTAAPVCVVEAGTGTGKTVAYGLAAIPIAQHFKKTLVVSTATVALQEQLMNKDLPALLEHSGLTFTYHLAKGRGRYICPAKLDTQLNPEQPNLMPLYPDEIIPTLADADYALLQKMNDALATNAWDGDRDHWTDAINEDVWKTVITDHRQCANRRCSFFQECPFFKAREDVQKVDVIVANHDLVLSDLALGGGAILSAPEDSLYIFDEGHHLPEKTLTHFTYTTRVQGSEKWAEAALKTLARLNTQPGVSAAMHEAIERITVLAPSIKEYLQFVYHVLEEVVVLSEKQMSDNNPNAPHFSFKHGVVPDSLREMAKQLTTVMMRFRDALNEIVEELQAILDEKQTGLPAYEAEQWLPIMSDMLARVEMNTLLWTEFAREDDAAQLPQARWVSVLDYNGNVDWQLNCSPILAANTLQEWLWDRCFGAVLTSATLTALGKYDHFQLRSGVPHHSFFHTVPSSFRYESATLTIPPMLCDPRNPSEHTQAIIELLPELLNEEEGSLVLFSSRRQMRDVYENLPDDWQDKILTQDDYSKQEILRRHKANIDNNEGSIIFGLASFAEGVDLPGKYCTHVVIAKIPFAVPDDPLSSALSDWIERSGRNPFMEISVPEASMKLIQACGRLLRSEMDTGRITVLDRRLTTARYGKLLLDSLPPFQREIV